MTNLLNETIISINDSGHTENDIVFIGSQNSGHSCSWEEYKRIANREYDSGYGAAEVAQDLIIVFSDGQKMWRGEYDGSEWWEYSTPFIMPKELKSLVNLFADQRNMVGWVNLEQLN